jgi:predicted nuclease with TOPRIM domain
VEDKKYEAGRVEISSAEYRDLVKEATENAIAASEARSERWRVESERDKLKAELAKAEAEIADLKQKLDFIFGKNSSYMNTEVSNNG